MVLTDFAKGFWTGAGVLVAIWLVGKIVRIV